MFIWRLIAVLALIIFIGIILFLRKKKYLKNNYSFKQVADTLVRTVDIKKKDRNLIFSPANEKTSNYIEQYILSRKKGFKTCICKYNKVFNNISYYVTVFDRVGNIISVLKIKDNRKQDYSKIISLPLRCASINITIRTIDNEIVSSLFITPTKNTIVKYCLFMSLLLFTGLIVLRQVMLEIFASFYISDYFSSHNLMDLLVMFVVAALYFTIIVLFLLIKNGHFKKGRGINSVDI